MKSLPCAARPTHRTREFDETTIPESLRHAHSTRRGVWGRIRVLEGSLVYRILEPEAEELVLRPGVDGIVEPETRHEVRSTGPVRFYVEFLRLQPEG